MMITNGQMDKINRKKDFKFSNPFLKLSPIFPEKPVSLVTFL